MLLRAIISILFFALPASLQAVEKPLIGMSKEHVKTEMRSEYKMFSPDNSVTKQHFNYLKYVNGRRTITWIIYFSDQDICTTTKKVCDYSEYDSVLEEINNKYRKVGNHEWEYDSEDRTYTVKLVEEDWYFTIRERLKVNRK
ncbi:MAG: hypothetical protein WD052_12435 [Bacteroidales bacterium]